MITRTLAVDPDHPADEPLLRAAELLRRGGLVAFPTETVYGLGANALDADAVARIFPAKGRPAHNPVIVHLASAEDARRLVSAWPRSADLLAERFWPGPLTLVLPRAPGVPDVVTAGGPTVAVRVPAHPVALALLRAAQLPVAAPSANRSSRLSPTRAEHVRRDLDGRVDLILDGGPTTGGIESTVLDLTARPPRLLRPGLVDLPSLEAVLGPVARPGAPRDASGPLRAPGMLARHYSPRTPLACLPDGAALVEELARAGARVGWVTLTPRPAPAGVLVVPLPPDPAGYAAQLYEALHHLDDADLERIVVDLPPESDEWMAVRDRLARASSS